MSGGDFESLNVEAAEYLSREDLEPAELPSPDEYAPGVARPRVLGFCEAGCGERAAVVVSRMRDGVWGARALCDACLVEDRR